MQRPLRQDLPQFLRDDPATQDLLQAFERLLLSKPEVEPKPQGPGTESNARETDPNLRGDEPAASDNDPELAGNEFTTQEHAQVLPEDLKNQPGLEELLDALPRYFMPGTSEKDGAPDEFLPWLSKWVALSLRTDISYPPNPAIDNAIRRALIGKATQLYVYRGTKKSMTELLETFTAEVKADPVTGQLTLTTIVPDIDDQIDDAPHFFEVKLHLGDDFKLRSSIDKFKHVVEMAHSVIRLEKPAQTRYRFTPVVTAMQIGQQETPPQPEPDIHVPTEYNIQVGKNTRLGLISRKHGS